MSSAKNRFRSPQSGLAHRLPARQRWGVPVAYQGRRSREVPPQILSRTHTYTGRDWPEKADIVLGLDSEHLIWNPIGTMEEARQVAKEQRGDNDEATVWDALTTQAPGTSQEDLISSTGLTRKKVSQALVGLKDLMGSEGSGGRGTPVRYFRLS